MKIEIKVLNKEFYNVEKMGGNYYDLPQYQTLGSCAMDLRCTEDVTIDPGETRMIKTGLAIWIASAYPYCGQSNAVAGIILPRSGLGTKGLVLANTIGLIDEDYQGELKIAAWNRNDKIEYSPSGYPLDKEIKKRHNNRPDEYYKVIELKAGDRVAQLIFVPIVKPTFKMVENFSINTQRGQAGFGSTGL